ncbi:MAG: hypothetical protein K5798_03915 [Nitrosopumilus sp.]|uniref:hypothetical protein n=1 Tax=Nitrosopumilus sp. TaxID=2024843 RepID=UPI00242CAB0B|nr:hypothetical protein [Nitrosopumilus sp.]MCV0366399.1 hypothetical protein [Nitrosopumilus sp.]
MHISPQIENSRSRQVQVYFLQDDIVRIYGQVTGIKEYGAVLGNVYYYEINQKSNNV